MGGNVYLEKSTTGEAALHEEKEGAARQKRVTAAIASIEAMT